MEGSPLKPMEGNSLLPRSWTMCVYSQQNQPDSSSIFWAFQQNSLDIIPPQPIELE
jgi:hypothetical protein